MTYEEAINCIKWNICYKQEVCKDGICKSTEDRPCAIDIAIECIEKQTPKKPIAYSTTWNGSMVYVCPMCGGLLGTKSFNEEQEQTGCARCLSAIDWNEVE